MHPTAEREGIAPQVRNFVRQAERTRKGQGVEKDKGLEKVNLRGTFSEANPARRGLAAGRNVYRNAANIAKQGIDFEDAIRILDGPVG